MMKPTILNPLLIKKYNLPVPRYTSYPTVPNWQNEIDVQRWQQAFNEQFVAKNASDGISIYVHLPFCESLCTYCGCNKKISLSHSVENEYLDAIEKEWTIYRKLMGQTPVIRAIHLGGGTPTFFSPGHLQRLIKKLVTNSIVHPHPEFSIEGHPSNTTNEHLRKLYALGFRRISYGVQDLNKQVQHVINRIQPFEQVQKATENARAAGFASVNFDLIYGLPLQTQQSIVHTINKVLTLRPDRIAFYSYAHVPWTNKVQRLFNEADLPTPEEKLALYLIGRQLLLDAGYYDIGMDHFALPHDELYNAMQNGNLHRNFMGYTDHKTGLLLGLGVSAISDSGNAFAQNDKSLHNYYELLNKNTLPVKRGWFLNEEEIVFRQHILDIACKGYTIFQNRYLTLLEKYTFPQLALFEADGLIQFSDKQLQLTETGRFFIRNICSAFDLFLQRNTNNRVLKTYSNAI